MNVEQEVRDSIKSDIARRFESWVDTELEKYGFEPLAEQRKHELSS